MIKIKDLFICKYGINLEFNKMTELENGISFVSRTSQNNGVVGYVEKIDNLEPNPAMTLSLAVSGSVMECFLQEEEYYSGRDLYYLQPKINLTKIELLYYCSVIQANKYRYSYARQANKTFDDILVPAPEEIPTWVYETQIPEVSKKPFHHKQVSLDDREWMWFKLLELFEIKKTKPEHKNNLTDGDVRYITRTATDNGLDGFFNCINIENRNCITVGGESAIAFYQDKEFSTGNNITLLRLKKSSNKFIYLYLVSILNKELYRYSYGRARTFSKLKNEKIKLPVNQDGKPDWDFMEYYIKSLPYSSNLKEELNYTSYEKPLKINADFDDVVKTLFNED